MPERRERPRVPIREKCLLSINDRQVRAEIENLSEIGGLFQIIEPGAAPVTDDDLGMEAGFLLSTVSPARQYTGEIIRLYFAGGVHHIALRFWKKYHEVPGGPPPA
jgi:hypothetical protein